MWKVFRINYLVPTAGGCLSLHSIEIMSDQFREYVRMINDAGYDIHSIDGAKEKEMFGHDWEWERVRTLTRRNY